MSDDERYMLIFMVVGAMAAFAGYVFASYIY